MPKEKRESEAEKVKIYIDTCILQGAMSRRNREDTVFLKTINEKGWKVYTSIHTLMELLDIAKDRNFLMKSVINKWVDASSFLRERKTKNLSRNDLDEIAEELNNFFINHSFIEFMNINEEGWNDVKEIAEKSNLHSSDALHLALARMRGCHVLVTHDAFFIKEGNKLLKEGNQYDVLRICNVDKVEETLKDLAIECMPERQSLERTTQKQAKTYAVEEIRQDYPKAYEKWTSEEDEALTEQFKKNVTISQLAKMHQRKIGAIRSRLRKLGLLAA